MKKLCILLSIITFALFSLSTSGCNSAFSSLNGVYFGTSVYISVRGQLSDEHSTDIKAILSDLENEFSPVKAGSKIKSINDGAINLPVEFSDLGKQAISLAYKYHDLTDGGFSPALYPLTKLWRFDADSYPVENFTTPETWEIQSAKDLCSLSNFSNDNGVITKLVDGAELDFGAILKGFATDKIADYLQKNGFTEGYVSVGGSSLKILSVNNELKIKHPVKSGEFIASVKPNAIKNTPLSTSGGYERFYTVNDAVYTHIIDANTGLCNQGEILSLTVFGVSATFADAISTSAISLDYDERNPKDCEFTEFFNDLSNKKDYDDCNFFAVIDCGQIFTSFSADEFTLLDDNYTVIYA